MEWRGEGILLSVRRHGETSAIIDVFTPDQGRHAGVVKGGAGRKLAPILQPGAQLDVTWRARLDAHIGSYLVEPVRSRAAEVMGSRLALSGLGAALALLRFCLPERQAHAGLYTETERLLDLLGQDDIWPLAYLRWEMRLLEDMGYGLDLSACAVTGARDNLAYISPKSGRAVSADGAGDWAARLLPLPDVLRGLGAAEDVEVAKALHITGFFLREKLAPDLGNRPVPEARARFIQAFEKRVTGAKAPDR